MATAQRDPLSETREDFYSLLGVHPAASVTEIKLAYRQLMRELHPDLASATMDEEQVQQATALAVLLNEIYDTLSDHEKRSTYNMLSGFSMDSSLNPFDDPSFPRDQTFVDELSCIGCAMCVRACPETFAIEDSMYGRARVIRQRGNDEEATQIALETCPVDCIHYVTLPQLPLLEAALAAMPRTDAFILQRSGGEGGNVFWEAYKAYERRRSAMNDRVQAAAAKEQSKGGGGGFWAQGRNSTSAGPSARAEDQEQEQQPRSAEERRIMNLAAIAARASRLWRQNGGGVSTPKGSLKA